MAKSGIITSQGMPLQLSKALDEMSKDTLANIETEYSKVLKIESAPAGRTHYQAEYAGLDLGGEIGESEAVFYSTPVEGNPIMRGYKQYGGGFAVSDLAIKDDHWGNITGLAADLAETQQILVELEGLKFYNEAEIGTAGSVAVVKDNKAICAATGHNLLDPAIDFQQLGGVETAANRLYNIPITAGDLTETTFREGFDYYNEMVSEKGYKKKMMPSQLFISVRDQYIAHRLATQEFGGTTDLGGLDATLGNGNKSFTNSANGFVKPWTPVVLRYLDDDRWFLMAPEHDNKLRWKEQPEQKSFYDFDHRTTRYSSVMRFGVWAYEYKATYGNITGVARSAS